MIEARGPQRGIALCLSGGGYRAMLFHVGGLLRLNEMGLLRRLDHVSSVSGGSIAAGVLGANWGRLDWGMGDVAGNLEDELVGPLRDLAGRSIDTKAAAAGMFAPGSAADRVAAVYKRHLFGNLTLQDLPDAPEFVINAASLQTGALWRLSKERMADYRVGEIKSPDLPLATAVAASSAFPPVLSPLRLKLDESAFEPNSGKDLQCPPYTTKAVLTDGGVYDNLGLETAFKHWTSVLISDGGGYLPPKGRPVTNWPLQFVRVTKTFDNGVRSLRKRAAVDAFEGPIWSGAFWGIRTDIANYELPDAISCDHERTLRLANVKTRLKKVKPALQEQIINWGYAVADAAVRKHFEPDQHRAPAGFPYPDSGIGAAT